VVEFSSTGKPIDRRPSSQDSGTAASGSQPGALDRVMRRNLPPEVFQRIEQQFGSVNSPVDAGHCIGSGTCNHFFDQGTLGPDKDDVRAPAPDRIFKGAAPAPVSGTFRPVTSEAVKAIQHEYGTIPGGVVLEGAATRLGRIDEVQYDGRYNAFTLDDRAVYFSPVDSVSVAVLARAIAQDNRVAVSLGRVQLVYGAVPENSDVARDLKLADSFLGDIVFAHQKWIKEYKFADKYVPEPQLGDFNVAVFFNFNEFEFRIANEEVKLDHVNFNVTLVPLAEGKSAEGGHLPDVDAISAGRHFPQYEKNARHLSDNIGHYRQEKIIEQTFAYGELAAFLRGLKESGADLRRLASAVEWSTGAKPGVARLPTPDVAEMRRPIDNLFDAWRRIDVSEYLAQWAPDAIKYDKDKRIEFAELRSSREILFSQIAATDAVYSPIYRGYSNGIARFDEVYNLAIRLKDGRTSLEEKTCESYKIARRADRWVIIENRDTRPCEEIDQSLRAEYAEQQRRMESDWVEYLRQIQIHNYHVNWPGPPYDLYTGGAGGTSAAASPTRLTYTSLDNRDLSGRDLMILKDSDLQRCASACNSESSCQGYSFDRWNRYCFLKSEIDVLLVDPRSTSGIREHVQTPPMASVPTKMERFRGRMFPGAAYKAPPFLSFELCEAACKQEEACIAFTFRKDVRVCQMFNKTGQYFGNSLADSGIKRQQP
jgi:PAN domain-containing protein